MFIIFILLGLVSLSVILALAWVAIHFLSQTKTDTAQTKQVNFNRKDKIAIVLVLAVLVAIILFAVIIYFLGNRLSDGLA